MAQVHKGVFLVQFDCLEERERVVEEGILTFDKKLVVIKPWRANIDVTKEAMEKVPIWVC